MFDTLEDKVNFLLDQHKIQIDNDKSINDELAYFRIELESLRKQDYSEKFLPPPQILDFKRQTERFEQDMFNSSARVDIIHLNRVNRRLAKMIIYNTAFNIVLIVGFLFKKLGF